jgi:uncharacterized protein (TIGR02147 family)
MSPSIPLESTEPELRPNIFEFLDYKDFLVKMFNFLKKTSRGFSHRNFARLAGFHSSGVLTNVIQGRKALSAQGARKVAKGFKLNANEADYLVDLVHWANEKDSSRRPALLNRVLSSRAFHLQKPLSMDQFQYFSDLRMPVVRELILAGMNTRSDILHHSRLEMTEEELEKILLKLKSLRLVQEQNGILKVLERQAHTENECPSEILKEYHRQMISKGIDAIDEIESTLREVQALTLSMSPQDIPLLKKSLHRFLHDIATQFERTENTERVVYQLNLQAFPFSK